jgi:hypothetical protein
MSALFFAALAERQRDNFPKHLLKSSGNNCVDNSKSPVRQQVNSDVACYRS